MTMPITQVGSLKGMLDAVEDDRPIVVRIGDHDYSIGRVDLPYEGAVVLYPGPDNQESSLKTLSSAHDQ